MLPSRATRMIVNRNVVVILVIAYASKVKPTAWICRAHNHTWDLSYHKVCDSKLRHNETRQCRYLHRAVLLYLCNSLSTVQSDDLFNQSMFSVKITGLY